MVTPVLRTLAASQLCFDVVGVLERACDIVLDLRLASQGRGDSALLARKTFAFLNMYLSVIGVDEAVWTLKFHLSMHMSMQYVALQREVPGMALPNCFVLERKHKCVKKHMKGRLNPQSYERGVMEELLLDHIAALQEGGPEGTIGEHAPRAVAERADLQRLGDGHGFVSAEWRSPATGQRFKAGDVVYASNGLLGEVQRFARLQDDRPHAMIRAWTEVAKDDESGSYIVSDETFAVQCRLLVEACIHSSTGRRRTVIF